MYQIQKKQDPTVGYLQETQINDKDKHKLNMKGLKNIIQANETQKEAGVFTSDKVNFKLNLFRRDKVVIFLQGTMHQEALTMVNIYTYICNYLYYNVFMYIVIIYHT
jgi:hypothetical protein